MAIYDSLILEALLLKLGLLQVHAKLSNTLLKLGTKETANQEITGQHVVSHMN